MPLYEFECPEHGLFQVIRGMEVSIEPCPVCGKPCPKRISAPSRIIVEHKAALPYGSGSRGKFIPSEETGGLSVFVPSWGAMEKEEVDYVAEIAVAKEKERVARNQPLNEQNAQTKEALGNIVKIAKGTKEGERYDTIKKVKREGLR